ncbi:MAG TPA: hypothetical protein VED40_22465 [Azospirillaceae bacterium]|nr:hypothetical protein [Azospirillaceae bacterium]
MHHREALEPILAFLGGIGIGVAFGERGRGGFLPGTNVQGGVIHVDLETLPGSGDLLHEAGHIAIVPRRHWHRLGPDLQADVETALADETAAGEPDPALRMAAGMGEFMAQAWSYAAALQAGVTPASVFFPGSYKHHEYQGAHPMQAWIESGTHHGARALAEVGMTGFSGLFRHFGDNGLPPFPQMNRWTLD